MDSLLPKQVRYFCADIDVWWLKQAQQGNVINYLTYYDKKILFHTADASDKVHNAQCMLSLMEQVIDQMSIMLCISSLIMVKSTRPPTIFDDPEAT